VPACLIFFSMSRFFPPLCRTFHLFILYKMLKVMNLFPPIQVQIILVVIVDCNEMNFTRTQIYLSIETGLILRKSTV